MFWKRSHLPLTTYQAGLLQSQAYRALSNFLTERLNKYQLSLPGWAGLGTINDAKQLRASELAAALGVKPPVATKLVDELVRLELVQRLQSPDDSRVTMMESTAKGRELATAVEKALRHELREYLHDISLAELVVYLRVLKKLSAKLP